MFELNAPVLPETVKFFSSDFIECVHVCIERFLSSRWCDVYDCFKQAALDEPIDPFEGFLFDGICLFSRVLSVDHLCFELPNHRLGQRIVIAFTYRSNSGFQPRVSQPYCVYDRQILAGFNRSL